MSCTTAGLCTYTPTGNEIGIRLVHLHGQRRRQANRSASSWCSIKTANLPPHGRRRRGDDAGRRREDDRRPRERLRPGSSTNCASSRRPLRRTEPSTARATGDCLYTPALGYTGPDSFTYTITDGLATGGATVSITVTPNTAPARGRRHRDDQARQAGDHRCAPERHRSPTAIRCRSSAHSSAAHGTVECTSRDLHLHARARVRRHGLVHVHGERRPRHARRRPWR